MQRNKGKKSRKLTVSLAVLLVMGLAVTAMFPLHAKADAIDLGKTCDFTLTLPKQYIDQDTTAADSLDIVLDVYQLAEAKAVNGYDTYTFAAATAFAALGADLDKLTKQDTDAPSDEKFAAAAAAVVKDAASLTPAAEGKAPGAKIEVSAGLYLVLAHGKGLAKAEYFSELEGSIVTTAESDMYTYSFAPMLISVPTKRPDADGAVLTSNIGVWIYSVEAELKPKTELKRVSLTITKQLNSYLLDNPTTFAFQIDYKDGLDDRSVVRELVFSKADIGTIVVENIPFGTEVLVTERYSGANYRLVNISGGGSDAVSNLANATITIPAITRENNGVTFENDYKGSRYGEGSIDNIFTAVRGSDGSLNWGLRSVNSSGEIRDDFTVRRTR